MMIAMEARAPALNRLRSWTLAADQDLFGQWQAVVTFGRIGQHGDTRCRKTLASLALCDARWMAEKRHAQDRRQLRID